MFREFLQYHLRRVIFYFALTLLLLLISCQVVKEKSGVNSTEDIFYQSRNIFQHMEYGKECHSSTITELANGDLLAAWWCGSFEGSTDAAIYASRFRYNINSWEPVEKITDMSDRFEGNPVLFTLPDGRVWLFFVIKDPELSDIVQIMFRESKDNSKTWSPIEKFITKPNFRTRNHPIIINNKEILLPLFDRLTGQSVFLITRDFGKTWEESNRIISEKGNIQPTVISRDNGSLYALMRIWDDDPAKRYLLQSESYDYGRTWSIPTYSKISSVSSAPEIIRLKNGHIVLAFNNGKERERTPLTVALSFDEGRSWSFKRNLESGPGSFSYPSIVQTKDGHIHITYSYNRKFIKHVEVNEEWIRSGE